MSLDDEAATERTSGFGSPRLSSLPADRRDMVSMLQALLLSQVQPRLPVSNTAVCAL